MIILTHKGLQTFARLCIQLIESVNSSLRKVTKKGFFENENSVFKIFYLRITGELAKKWNNAKMQNWAKVLNQLSCLDETSDRIARYIR